MTFTSFSRTLASLSAAAIAATTTATAAQAFTFGTTTSGQSPTGDILLESVTVGSRTIDDFVFVSGVTIVANDAHTTGNTGAASADIGDQASTGVVVEAPTAQDLLINLSNNNLNNIVDTEDRGHFIIDLEFGQEVDQFFLFERGMNSRLRVQALDSAGGLLGNAQVLNSAQWTPTDFTIDTHEIDEEQAVGSYGIGDFSQFFGTNEAVHGLRVSSNPNFNGPDWKVVASAQVPEPASLLGLGLVGSLFFWNRRQQG
ncbi:MAG: exosortase-dependent surface protein XDP2 [Leptolyngbyaceae cyanobacterium]